MQRQFRPKWIGAIVGLVMVALVISGCGSQASPAPTAVPAKAEVKPTTAPVQAEAKPTAAPAAAAQPTAAPAKPETKPAAAPITWVWAHSPNVANTEWQRIATEELAQRMKKATDGRLNIEVRIDLIPTTEVLAAVRDGRVNGGFQGTMYRGDIALWNWGALPFLGHEDLNPIWPNVKNIIVKSADEQFGVQYAAFGLWPRQVIFSKRPLQTIDDLKGFKFRSHSRELADLMKAAGAVPVTVEFGEVLPSLQRGVLDGAVSSGVAFTAGGWGEVTKYINAWPIGQAAFMLIVNKNSWNALPADLKPIVTQVFQGLETDLIASGKRDDDIALPQLQQKGAQFITPGQSDVKRFSELAAPIADDWAKRAGPSGPDVLSIVRKTIGR